jgi:protein-tyrosine phosphatase
MRILFVCTGNACRSPVAQALMKKLKPSFDVDSAGTNPHYEIIESSKIYLKKQKAAYYLKDFPEGLDNKKLNEYDLIVAMKKRHKEIIVTKCPECEDKITVWEIDDPYRLPVEESDIIFNKIKSKINKLARSVQE